MAEFVEAVQFGFMTNEKIHNHSVVRVRHPGLVDILRNPITGGLYDPALGSLDENSPCKSCGQSENCTVHFGHIDLVQPVYNPLLFHTLNTLLDITCFKCCHFRASKHEVESCVSQLELIMKGDIVGAKKLGLHQIVQDKKKSDWISSIDIVDADGHTSDSTVLSNVQNHNEHDKDACWDSSHLTKAMSVLDEFFKREVKKCKKCKGENPRVTKPTFEWCHLSRSSAIQRCRSDSSEKRSKKRTKRISNPNHGLEEQISSSSRQLSPSEVKDLVRRLWENEASLCSYICNILPRQSRVLINTISHSMFFIETVLVPPIKFRPPAKGGDSIMEHPHTVLLENVLQSQVALIDAYAANAEYPRIISRWMDLQHSINVLFDSKTATGSGQTSGIYQFLETKEGIFRQK